MAKEVQQQDTTRATAYELWIKAPNPMVTFFKRLDVTNLIKVKALTELQRVVAEIIRLFKMR